MLLSTVVHQELMYNSVMHLSQIPVYSTLMFFFFQMQVHFGCADVHFTISVRYRERRPSPRPSFRVCDVGCGTP